MRVTTLIVLLVGTGLLLLLSATWNVGGDVKRHVPDASTSTTRAQSGPYSAWASNPSNAAQGKGKLFPPDISTTIAQHAKNDVKAAAAVPLDALSMGVEPMPVEQAPTPVAAAPARRAAVPCAPGCEKHGVCNSELGRCDCPPFVGGAACDQPLVAACSAAVGLTTLAPAPCVYDQLSTNAPVSCECLMGCEAIGLMGVRECYVMDPSNRTVASWVQQQIHVRGLAPNHEFWDAKLKSAHAESVKRCGGRGVYAPRMPATGAGGGLSRCWCYAGFAGNACEQSTSKRQQHACLNGCSGRGACVRNWCHCSAGFYGTDCSLGSPADGSPAPALPPPIGAQRDAKAPKVYIYDLPPRFNGWMHAGDAGWWQDFDLWGEDVIIHRRALRSVRLDLT
jgi:hypothetical protein